MTFADLSNKEFAEVLRERLGRGDGDYEGAALDIADKLGVELKPDRPKAGTWHRVTEGQYRGELARVNSLGNLMVFNDLGGWDTFTETEGWPRLEPAPQPGASESFVTPEFEPMPASIKVGLISGEGDVLEDYDAAYLLGWTAAMEAVEIAMRSRRQE